MNFPSIVVQLKAEPTAFLDSFCVLSLGSFLVGYGNADSSAHAPTRALLDVFPGADSASACMRAYLSYPGTGVAAAAILDALEKEVSDCVMAPEPGAFPDTDFITTLRGPILQGRPAMILGTPTVITLYNYVRGFLCGLEAVAPAEAERQTRDLAEFERWLQGWYKTPGTAWYKLLRIYGGECERGLLKFVEMWDEFEKSRKSKSTE